VRRTALACAVGATPALPPDKNRARIAARLRSDGLEPEVIEAEWRQARVEGRTKSDYATFANAKRDAARCLSGRRKQLS
jgi:hypothetical protein